VRVVTGAGGISRPADGGQGARKARHLPSIGGSISRSRYILIARILHWVLSIGMIAEIILGLYSDGLPYGAGQAAAHVTFLYSIHKTAGIALLAVAILFAAWLQLGPGRPAPEGRIGWDHALGRLVYWGLFVAMLAIPVTGPILHGNGPSWGYAPIFWPWSDRIPGVPDAFASNRTVSAFHAQSWWLFAGLSTVHTLLWFRRRHLRRRYGAGPRPPGVTVSAKLLRLAPWGGVLMWLAVAALVA
jgi:cytochrome b561